MINHIIPTLARRAFEAHASFQENDGDKVIYEFPTWGALMLSCTFIFFIAIMAMIEYTFGRVLPTLLMIESPQEAIVSEPLSAEDPDSAKNNDPEQTVIKIQPITASFRQTIHLLQSVGGFRARFRGLGIYIITGMVVNMIGGFLSVLPRLTYLPKPFWNAAATVICATLSMAWTHIVISEPSPKPWFKRVPSMRVWKKIAAPTAVLAVAEQLAVFVPVYLAIVTGYADTTPQHLVRMNHGKKAAMGFGGLGFLISGLALALLLVVPANVALTRVQASLLADTEETIVPFDRSFGSKVIPEIVGGPGVIGMLDAWKSFDWASRVRLVKTYLKVFAMQVAVTFAFVFVLVAQLLMIVGTDWSKLIPDDGEGKKGL